MAGVDMISPNENERMEDLKDYKILHTKPEPVFDQLVAITAKMLDIPLAIINFVDNYKVWTLNKQNADTAVEIDDKINLCSIAIKNSSTSIFENEIEELCLISNPLIAGEHGFLFYAAAPIITNGGINVGTVCVVDKISRTFSLSGQKKLDWVASMIRIEMNKRITVHAVA